MKYAIDIHGKPFVGPADIGRIARRALREGLAPDNDKALDLVARLFGERDYFALLQRAKSGNMAGWPFGEIAAQVTKTAITLGYAFPPGLRAPFDGAWQDEVTRMLQSAVDAHKPNTLSFVALAGGPGRGKTLAANHFVAKAGGRVVDVGLHRAQLGLYDLKPGELLCFDRPAINPEHSEHLFERVRVRAATGAFTLVDALKVFREPSIGIPMDEISFQESPARQFARERPLIIAFPSEQAVADALQHAHTIRGGDGTFRRGANWEAAHVVNLEAMSTTTLFGPVHAAP